ncbi:MAG: hypothetical protein ACK4FF_13975 [Limnobacter sp.]|uniref:hypothetical protein n=1 Tax=Limnobacter sp. TaxID=2003368 RepID=UPI00391A4549
MHPSTPVKSNPALGIEHDSAVKGLIKTVQSPSVVKAAETLIGLKTADQGGREFSFQTVPSLGLLGPKERQKLMAEARRYIREQLKKSSPFFQAPSRF